MVNNSISEARKEVALIHSPIGNELLALKTWRLVNNSISEAVKEVV